MKSSFIRSVLAVLFISATAHAQCPGDVVPNGVVNGTDLAAVLSAWGTNGLDEGGADLNDDGIVNGQDLAAVLGGWGPCRPIITSISPNQGHVDGGALITISGYYLAGTTSVTIGGAPAAVTFISASSVRVTVPAGALGSTAIVLNTPAGTESIADGFTYVNITIPSWATLLQAEPDPAIVIDPELRASITSTGYAWRVRDTATQIELVLIPPGTFQMGCSASIQWGCNGDESPVHTVTLTNAFYMGRYEVTQAQWMAQMVSNPSHFQAASAQVAAEQVPNRPVEQVSWNMIQGFLSVTGMRLPSEAEWEYAYRAGTPTAFHSMPGYPSGTNDDSLLGSIAWIGSSSGGQTRPVGQLVGNGFGLYDMSGNVWEWVSDWWSGSYYTTSPSINPPGPSSGTSRVLRSGGWGVDSVSCRSSARGAGDPSSHNINIGFRVARNP